MSEPQAAPNRAHAGDGMTVDIVDQGLTGMITLRGDLSSPALQSAVTTCFGVPVPAPLTASFAEADGAVWMSPDELLLFCDYDGAEAYLARLSEALKYEHHMAINVSDARAVIAVGGAGAQELIAKGAPVDVSNAAFPPGTARRTHMAGVAVGIWRTGDEDWEIVCFQSFARHLFDWLTVSSGKAARVGYF